LSILVDHLSRRFGEQEAVKSIRFDVQAGTIFGLLGANGAGKTTTLRMLATLLQPTSGRATVAGHSILDSPLEVRRNLGYLTGDTGLYGRLTPTEIFRYFGQLHGLSKDILDKRIEWLAEGLAMGPFLHKKCEKLSTGQKQRVNIARALVHDPQVIVFDEPTAGLDILSAQFILDVLRGERDKGKTVLFSTHILSEAEVLCDTIGLLHQGELLSIGTLEETIEKWDASTLTQAMLQATRGNTVEALP
jgi:sodium transport system ATP-binding protein